jgi:flagellar protein FlaG
MDVQVNTVQQSAPGDSAVWGVNRVAKGAVESRPDKSGQAKATGGQPLSNRQAEETTKPVPLEALQAAVAEIEEELAFMQTRISFEIDSKADATVMRVTDRETGEVIRQFPPEEFLKIRTAFRDFIRGIFFDKLV